MLVAMKYDTLFFSVIFSQPKLNFNWYVVKVRNTRQAQWLNPTETPKIKLLFHKNFNVLLHVLYKIKI